MRFGVLGLTPAAIARALGVMAQNRQGLVDPISMQSSVITPWPDNKDKPDGGATPPQTWNVEVFVQVIKELVSCVC